MANGVIVIRKNDLPRVLRVRVIPLWIGVGMASKYDLCCMTTYNNPFQTKVAGVKASTALSGTNNTVHAVMQPFRGAHRLHFKGRSP